MCFHYGEMIGQLRLFYIFLNYEHNDITGRKGQLYINNLREYSTRDMTSTF